MGHFYDVDVYRLEDEDGGEPWWGAEGGLENDSVGVEFESTQDLAELVSEVHDETITFRRKWPDLQVRWLQGRQPATDFLAAAQAAGIALP
jgi:hypothetical protein